MWEYLFVIKKWSQSVLLCIEKELEVAASVSLLVRVVCCSCGNKWGTCGSVEFLRELVVGVAAPSDLERSFLVEILHCGEGGDVEQVVRNSKQIFCVCDCLSFYQLTCAYILHAYYICAHLLHAGYYLCTIDIHAWDCLISWMFLFLVNLFMLNIVYVLTLVLNQESYWSTSTLNQEESCREILKLFIGNLASLLGYHLWVCFSCVKVFNSASFD